MKRLKYKMQLITMMPETRNEKRETRSKILLPDIQFIKRVKKESNSDLKACMQCGNCTVVCNLSPEENPFPRKEMIWAAWGQKGMLIADPDIWLCHQCGDCTSNCPRGVKPGNVLASLRSQTIEYYANPSFLVKWLKKWWMLPVTVTIPMIIIHLILIIAGTLTITPDPVNYSAMFPHALLNSSFSILALLMIVGIVFSIRSFWKGMVKGYRLSGFEPESQSSVKERSPIKSGMTEKATSIIKTIWQVKKELLAHKKFKDCETNKFRHLAHAMVFYGFVALIVVTLFAILSAILGNYPMPFLNPVKIVGNLAGLSIVVGLLILIFQRLIKKDAVSSSNFFDWSFLISILLLVITGFFTEYARLVNDHLGYYWYLFHLIIMWYVILYLPYTKFGHMVYRFAAMVFVIQTGRK